MLDAWRGICACLVCLFHFEVLSPLATTTLVRQSWQFVDFFFVLSGFVIAANYRERLAGGMPLGRFMGLRLGRVYPLHLVMLALFVLFELAGWALGHRVMHRQPFDAAHSLAAIPTNLLLLQSFGIEGRLTWNHPAWSIATEVWTYLLFALAVAGAGRHLDRWLLAAVLLCPLALLALAGNINVTYDYGLIRCVYGFALGGLADTVWRRWQPRASGGTATILEIAAVAGVGVFVCAVGGSAWNLLGPPLFAAVLLVFAGEGGLVSRGLATRLPLALGTLSYSIYMVHVFIQSRMDDALKPLGRWLHMPLTSETVTASGRAQTLVGATPAQGLLLTSVMLALVIAMAALTHRYIEQPGQRWSRRRFDARVAHGRE